LLDEKRLEKRLKTDNSVPCVNGFSWKNKCKTSNPSLATGAKAMPAVNRLCPRRLLVRGF
jgi:hypothetical protein